MFVIKLLPNFFSTCTDKNGIIYLECVYYKTVRHVTGQVAPQSVRDGKQYDKDRQARR
jgi:hypothetical protein